MAEAHADVLVEGNWLAGETAEQFAYRMQRSQIAIAAYRNAASLPKLAIEAAEEDK